MRKNVLGGKLLRNAKKSIKYQEDKYFSVSLHIFLIAIYLSYPLLICRRTTEWYVLIIHGVRNTQLCIVLRF